MIKASLPMGGSLQGGLESERRYGYNFQKYPQENHTLCTREAEF